MVTILLQSIPSIKLLPGGQSIAVSLQPNGSAKPMEPTAIGTLSFIDPNTYRYGAFGHLFPGITKENKKDWMIKAAVISGVQRAKVGTKTGCFSESRSWGTIVRNTAQGIFGEARGLIPNPYFKEPLEIAALREVRIGPAKIYTVIEGERIQEFKIRIETITSSWQRGASYMNLSVTDPLLYKNTGGIVKGMSGSPIIQNDKIIGVVSYLSAKNSRNGYAIFAEKMIADLFWRESAFSLHYLKKVINVPSLG